MRCSLGISNYLEEISSLSHSTVFLYFFALITEEGFLFFFKGLCYLISFSRVQGFWLNALLSTKEVTILHIKPQGGNTTLPINSRLDKRFTRDLFKKTRDTKGTFHGKMGSIKDRNGRDLIEAEDIEKRWQEYTEKL